MPFIGCLPFKTNTPKRPLSLSLEVLRLVHSVRACPSFRPLQERIWKRFQRERERERERGSPRRWAMFIGRLTITHSPESHLNHSWCLNREQRHCCFRTGHLRRAARPTSRCCQTCPSNFHFHRGSEVLLNSVKPQNNSNHPGFDFCSIRRVCCPLRTIFVAFEKSSTLVRSCGVQFFF